MKSKAEGQHRAGSIAMPTSLLDCRNDVYSQNGEDGIIEVILSKLPSLNHWCVEFGAWDGIYLSNTRNLIAHRNYRAILIEANKKSFYRLKENTKAYNGVMTLNATVGFSPSDSLDVLLSTTPCPRDPDLLSVDIDGNDIHVWRALKHYRPKVICIEFNPTIPTEVTFEQPADAKINWGCSLAALVQLGKEKGYELICTNEVNAFFVTSELFPVFSIVDNSASALRPNDAPRRMVFIGYDGTLLLTGDILMPWHEMSFTQRDIQPIPAWLRKYPQNFTFLERRMAHGFRFLHRARKFVRSEGWPSRAFRKLLARSPLRVPDLQLLEGSLNQTVRKMLRQWLGERAVGSIDYFRFPELRSTWGGPFNGQRERLRIFEAIVARVRPHAIVETGTYLGTTTEAMAASGLPVYTIEADPRRYGFARMRLWRKLNVKVRHGDSRAELERLFDGALKGYVHAPLFFYLDAHWDADLPLAEEIDCIFDRAPNAVVMIDDFQVPDDSGFGYDDYGPGKVLNVELIGSLILGHGLAIFYPSTPSEQETGMRRGCAVLCKAAVFGDRLESLSLLRRAVPA